MNYSSCCKCGPGCSCGASCSCCSCGANCQCDLASQAICAKRAPIGVEVEAGQDYYWCSCGRSKSQPFCDGSHQGTDFTPVKFTATETKKVYFCGCKQSAAGALCDGSHKKLPEDAEGKGFPPKK